MGDFNAVIGSTTTGDGMGMESEGERSDNGERLLSFCSANGLDVGGSLFKYRSIHKGTWRSPEEFLAISRRTDSQSNWLFLSLKEVDILSLGCSCVQGGRFGLRPPLGDCLYEIEVQESIAEKDHYLIDIEKLKLKQVKKSFELALHHRFSILSDLENLESDPNAGDGTKVYCGRSIEQV